jgi:hypothetical protein
MRSELPSITCSPTTQPRSRESIRPRPRPYSPAAPNLSRFSVAWFPHEMTKGSVHIAPHAYHPKHLPWLFLLMPACRHPPALVRSLQALPAPRFCPVARLSLPPGVLLPFRRLRALRGQFRAILIDHWQAQALDFGYRLRRFARSHNCTIRVQSSTSSETLEIS